MKLIPRPFTLYALLVDTTLWVAMTAALAVLAMKMLSIHPVPFVAAAVLAVACGATGVAYVSRAVRTYRNLKRTLVGWSDEDYDEDYDEDDGLWDDDAHS